MKMFFDVESSELTETYDNFWDAWMQSKPANEIPAHISALTHNFFTGMLSSIALSTAVYTGIPLVLRYIASVAEKKLSQPKLVIEARYTNWFDQLMNAKSHNIVELFIKTIGYGASLSFAVNSALKNNILHSSNYLNTWKCFIEKTVNGSFYRVTRFCDNTSTLSPWARTTAAVAIGVFFAIYQASWLLPKLEFSKGTLEEKPIFHAELASTLENIAKTTNNLKKNKHFLQNILLYGPGGTGKTMIAKYLARKSDMNYLMISGGDLAQYIKLGTHVTELNKLFLKIKLSSTPTILFIDEAESLCRSRSQLITEPERLELLNAFLNHTGENSKKLLLILATNRPEDIDPAVLSRMDYKLQIYPPALLERAKILKSSIAKLFTDKEAALFDVEKIAKDTEGLTGRALFKMINAIFANKSIAHNEQLTEEIISSTVNHFIRQEKCIAESISGKRVESTENLCKITLEKVQNLCKQLFCNTRKTVARA